MQKKFLLVSVSVRIPHYLDVFSCPADSSIGDIVTHSLTHWVSDLFKNTTAEWPQRLVTFETFDQSDGRTRPDQQKDDVIDKYKDKDNDKDKYI